MKELAQELLDHLQALTGALQENPEVAKTSAFQMSLKYAVEFHDQVQELLDQGVQEL